MFHMIFKGCQVFLNHKAEFMDNGRGEIILHQVLDDMKKQYATIKSDANNPI